MTPSLLNSLVKPSAYPEPTGSVVLLQTHVSYLFLTDRYVYKVKKSVNFGFLDFSTLDKRRFYCDEEVRLNGRLSPELYLGVVALRQTPQGCAFYGEGTILDFAVKMRRLPEDRMLSRLLEKGGVGAAEMCEIARTVAKFHLQARRGPEIDALGTVSAIASNWEENFRQIDPFLRVTIEPWVLHPIRSYVARFLELKGELFRARLAAGYLRECDGDIHSANICLAERVFIFDCIEFNERFRYCDTAADVAFLLMDLEFAGRPELAEPFLACYRELTGDPLPDELTDFYKAQRAFVRGKVESFELNDPELPKEQRDEAKTRARRYFRLSRGFALRDKLPPSLIITCGILGSGKSTLAGELSFELGLELFRGDLVRKELFTPGGPTEEYAGGIYTPAHNRATYDELLRRAQAALALGKSIVVDSTFRREEDRALFAWLAKKIGVPFLILKVECDEKTVRKRLMAREGNAEEVSNGRLRHLAAQQSEYEPPLGKAVIAIDGAQPLERGVDAALKGMGLLP